MFRCAHILISCFLLPDNGGYVADSWVLSCIKPDDVQMTYNITMERTLSLSIDFEAENDDETPAKAEQIYYGAKTDEFEDGGEAFGFALCAPQTGRMLIDWKLYT